MTRRDKIVMTVFIILAILFLLSIPIKVVYPQEKPVEGPQIIMKVVPSAGPWLAVVPQDVTLFLGLAPLDPDSHYAPLNPGDTLLCHAYSPDGGHYAYRCGTSRYGVLKFDVFSNHKPKKEKP